jgi:putative sigma-54 modulation protein
MDIKINSVHFNASTRLEDFVINKVNKLLKNNENVIGAEVFLRLEKNENSENKVSEIKLNVPKSELFARKQAKTFEEATDLSIEALRRQLVRYKETIKGK